MNRKMKIDKMTQLRRGGQNYRNIIFLLFFLPATASLFSQDRNQSSLYLGTLEIGSGVSKDKETKTKLQRC